MVSMTNEQRRYIAMVELDPELDPLAALKVGKEVWGAILDNGVEVERAEVSMGEPKDGQMREPKLNIELYGVTNMEKLGSVLEPIDGVTGTWVVEKGSESVDVELGTIVARERRRRGLTAEQAAKEAGLAYKTWLRIESGKSVRNQSWSGVDRLFGLDDGTTLRIKSNPPDQVATDFEDAIRNAHVAAAKEAAERSGSAHAIAPAAHASGEGAVTGPSLADRIRGLDLDDLRRLRDIVDGAIIAREALNDDRDIAAAAAALVNATEYEESLRAEWERSRAQQLGDDSELRDQLDYAKDARIRAQVDYEVLQERERRLNKARRYGLPVLPVQKGTDDGER